MRQLLPVTVGDVDGPARYTADERPKPEGRPWILLDMVTSVDGATRVGSTSGGLSGPADKAIFSALRTVADFVLVGANTVRAEGYGPPKIGEDQQRRRTEGGQEPTPRLAVVSARAELDPGAKLFSGDGPRPLIITTTSADPRKRAALADVAEVVALGQGLVSGDSIAAALDEREAKVVTCEGGPTLNGFLMSSRVVDEICWAISPHVVGGESLRLGHGPVLDPPEGLRLERVLEDDGFLFLRYVRV